VSMKLGMDMDMSKDRGNVIYGSRMTGLGSQGIRSSGGLGPVVVRLYHYCI
jgi:hypothetical protein